MAYSTQFNLSVELAKVFPVREAVAGGAESLASLVRAMRRSGSDFLVDEEIAAIFGRGRIESSLERSFRDAVKDASFTSLYANSVINLETTGPTIGRALRNRYYMSSVIQLSFLGWVHEEST